MIRHSLKRHCAGQTLIAALVALAFLMTVLGALSTGLLMEARFVVNESKVHGAYYTALAGVESACSQLLGDDPAVDTLGDAWHTDDGLKSARLGDGVYHVQYHKATGGLRPGVVDEQRKLNINKATRAMLQDLSEAVTPGVAKAIVARRIEEPFATVDELRTLDAVGPDVLTDELAAQLTTRGDGRVNVNTASANVLSCLGILTREQAEALVAHRNGEDGRPETDDDTPFATVDEVKGVLDMSDKAFEGLSQWLTVRSTHFTVAATGHPSDYPLLRRTVTRVVRRDGEALVIEQETVRTGQ